ncbi:hypothetical protein B0H14DRAFT_3487790 [Mycena olivaceomarginata]|nr:hypothetical protein B0H14DRAFT_3487790 [Mycena olivaceomarginata]
MGGSWAAVSPLIGVHRGSRAYKDKIRLTAAGHAVCVILTSAVVLTPEEDPAYITTTDDRAVSTPVDPTTYSPLILVFDAFTKDVASVATAVQLSSRSLGAQYTGLS